MNTWKPTTQDYIIRATLQEVIRKVFWTTIAVVCFIVNIWLWTAILG